MKNNNDEFNDDVAILIGKLIGCLCKENKDGISNSQSLDPDRIKKNLVNGCKLEDWVQVYIIEELVDRIITIAKALERRQAQHSLLFDAKKIVNEIKNSSKDCPRCKKGKMVTDNEAGEKFCSKCGFDKISGEPTKLTDKEKEEWK